jgi:matrixin
MAERPFSLFVSGLAILLVCAVLWDLFRGASAGRRAPPAPVTVDTSRSGNPQPATTGAQAAQVPVPGPPPGVTPAPSNLSYAELLARSEIRRRIRASAALTYLNEIVAASGDSMLHRWDDRLQRPVRVYLQAGEMANFTPEFLNAVRAAFERWQEAGVPVRWNLGADTTNAEVRFQWKVQIDQQRTGQTDLNWDQNGHLQSAVVTLATFDPKGQPLGFDGMRVIALHEIGHVLGLDHSSDTTDLMYPTTKVRDLSPRDIQTALLLYDLAPGSIR